MSADKAPHPNSASPAKAEQLISPPSGDSARNGITRRGFLKGAGITAAGTALLDGVHAFNAEAAPVANQGVTVLGPGAAPVILKVNGKDHSVEIEPRTTLAEALRIHLGMTGTKIVCDRGSCSGCTVWLDKMPVNSCTVLAIDAIGRQVTTIEGLSSDGKPHPLQAAFVKHDALQCGFCTPGMVMSCAALLETNPRPTEQDVRYAIAGNLCRCGTYPRIFSATLEVAGSNRKV
jgi:aerobic-type carbon monoxide dehydrogenase small subunit (CoxS/CutS family)